MDQTGISAAHRLLVADGGRRVDCWRHRARVGLADLHRSGVDLEGTLTALKLPGGSDHISACRSEHRHRFDFDHFGLIQPLQIIQSDQTLFLSLIHI